MKPKPVYNPFRLYALCDQATLERTGCSLEDFVALCRTHDAEIIQYRNKEHDVASVKRGLIRLRQLWDRFLIINDYPELASFCDGVHLGQEDLASLDPDPVKAIKVLKTTIGSDKLIGLSTHNEAQIAVANTLELNYVGLGAYRSTSTKEVANLLGDRLDTYASGSKHPVAAIGGVTFEDRFEHVTYHVIGSALFA